VWKDKKLDTDDTEHIEWLFQVASARANEFNIEGVTWALTQGVVKNIIPAIASTNAIIAASCCNEVFKLATSCGPFLNNYMMVSAVGFEMFGWLGGDPAVELVVAEEHRGRYARKLR
jgi:ubiquitin-activating enzyme E1 C